MAYQMLTRTGKSFWEVTSAMQNAIRKGEFEVAGYAMWELLAEYTPYLRKRLLVISAEDCFGVLTKEILELCEIGTEDSLTRALALLCMAKKNRDADYLVCNLMLNDQPTGADKDFLSRELFTAIRCMDVQRTGRYLIELFKKNRKTLWRLLEDMAAMYYPHLAAEFSALHCANERMTKPNEETIYVAKAVILMWTCRDPKEGILAYDKMTFDGLLDPEDIPVPKPLDECTKIPGLFPDWAYNWHTYYGKYKLSRDVVHAIENDQRILTPLEENLFDDCTWNHDINICLQKWNPRKHRLPYDDGKRRPEEKYGTQE